MGEHRRRRNQSRRGRTRFRPALLIGTVGILGIVVVLLIVTTNGNTTVASGQIAADHTTHDFGSVPISGGLIDARFALTTDQATVVKRIEST